ncbi:MAG: hypothetical protein A2W99_03810 [Bacteroidetes bacterium GWF2_33_16]|nr:MAG: hypothetical protein A2X00_12220 [Bacteroidetes bacterium GWE2_32_14]OFY02309.1 MAG: hypothetical protein A2W99_03810 [Bacteroidetes bacterium GWF2_33_16]
MKKTLLFILIVYSIQTYSQVDNLNLNNELHSEFEFSETELKCVLVNESEFNYLIWLSENDKSGLTNKELVNEHFFKIKGDFNLYNIATETLINLDSFSLTDCEVFTKVLQPNDTLNIILKVNGENSNLLREEFKLFLSKRLVLMTEKKAERITINDLDNILFKEIDYFIDRKCFETKLNK